MRSRIVGSEDFSSEILIAYEMGYRFQAGTDFSLDVAIFYNNYSDLYTVQPSFSAFGIDYVFLNGVSGYGRGGEIAADWKPTEKLTLEATYSFLDMEFSADELEAITTNVEDFITSASPEHMVSVRAAVDFLDNWQCNLWLRYIDEITTRNSTNLLDQTRELEDYYLLDINLVWSPTEHMDISLVGQNLLEDEQLQYTSEYVTPPTAIERSFFAKLTWRY
jgi:iron complex outermembrane receptor protein